MMNEFITGAAVAAAIFEKTDFLPNILNPISKEIGNALSSLFRAVFTPVTLLGEKADIYKENQLENYAKEIGVKISQIPEENLQPPRISVVGSALENSKYCLDEEKLRELFANLIASSIDSEKQSYVRQSFAEIIKQLEPIDADNLKYFAQFCPKKSNTNMITPPVEFPCVNYVAKKATTTLVVVPNIFLSGETGENYAMQSSSITNLIRLGLITCNYDSYFIDDSKYELYRKVPEYIILNKAATNGFTFDIQKGSLVITPLGRDFIKTCV